jgi:predicted nucleic acid-binding protein
MDILLDTNILIEHFAGHTPATEYLKSLDFPYFISSFTAFEILSGCFGERSAHLKERTEFIQRFCCVLSFDQESAEEAAAYYRKCGEKKERKQSRIDFFIGATAVAHDCLVATHNTGDFKKTNAKTVDPYPAMDD